MKIDRSEALRSGFRALIILLGVMALVFVAINLVLLFLWMPVLFLICVFAVLWLCLASSIYNKRVPPHKRF